MTNPSPHKIKTTKMSLCKLLTQRKTKVGCFKTGSEESSIDIVEAVKSPPNSPLRSHIRQRGSFNRNYSDPDSKSTKISLCCAMTESSRTPPHSHHSHTDHPSHFQPTTTISDRHDAHNDQDEDDEDVVLTKDTESQTISSNNNSPSKIDKPSDLTLVETCNNVISSSSKQINNISHVASPVKFADESSSDSSPVMFNKRLLPQRLSADNLLVTASSPTSSVRCSSPESARSVPETSTLKRSVSYEFDMKDEEGEEEDEEEEEDVEGEEGGGGSSTDNIDQDEQNEPASMDSLAKQALLAAQVLHLIPTEKARERNYLHGRIAANSLLGSVELERVLPKREIRIFAGTWNMNGVAPPTELNDFMLPDGLEHVPDIISIGTQESYSERFEWEVKLQETIGPSHVLFHSAVLGTLHLIIFIRRDLLWYCSVPEESSFSVRPGTAFRTKGAVAVSFILFGTSYLFITSHLTAHQEKVKERVHDLKRIVRSLDLPKVLPLRHKIKSKDVTQRFDCVIWSGDLNFRLQQSRDDVLHWLSQCKFPFLVDMRSDQLTKLISDGTCFSSFQEGIITFPPTYKYDPGTQNFDTSAKQRVPAYTDRILYKSRSCKLQCVAYSSAPSICTSDHKPVWGVFKCTVRPGIDTIPLAAGLFNREVYLEGIKRRAAELSRRELDMSVVCSVQ